MDQRFGSISCLLHEKTVSFGGAHETVFDVSLTPTPPRLGAAFLYHGAKSSAIPGRRRLGNVISDRGSAFPDFVETR